MQLIVNNLGKQYKRDFWGLKDFSLDIKPGIGVVFTVHMDSVKTLLAAGEFFV
jgi:hypothetical protein